MLCSSCIMRREDVGCPHDGYDPSYIREFHIMLVGIHVQGVRGPFVWPYVSRHNFP